MFHIEDNPFIYWPVKEEYTINYGLILLTP